MLPVKLSWKLSLSECGSIEIGSPWSAKRKVAAPAAFTASAATTSAQRARVCSCNVIGNFLRMREAGHGLQRALLCLAVYLELPVVGFVVESGTHRGADCHALLRRR